MNKFWQKGLLIASMLVLVAVLGLIAVNNPGSYKADIALRKTQLKSAAVTTGIPGGAEKYSKVNCETSISPCVNLSEASGHTSGLQFPGVTEKFVAKVYNISAGSGSIQCNLYDGGIPVTLSGTYNTTTQSYEFSDYQLPGVVGVHSYTASCMRTWMEHVCMDLDINTHVCNDLPRSDPAVASTNSVSIEITKCGNGTVDSGEQCDNGAQNANAFTCSYGQGTCTYCNLQCVQANATGPRCGDSVIQASEICDTNQFGSATCASKNSSFTAGQLTCESNCTSVGIQECGVCGDNKIQVGESCDDGTNNGQGCATGCGSQAAGWSCASTTDGSGTHSVCSAQNSCDSGNGGCDVNAQCTSTGPGTNTCACKSGYSGNGVTCSSVNSCALSNGGCDMNALCTSTGPGTNSCACKPGFLGDGSSCARVACENLVAPANGAVDNTTGAYGDVRNYTCNVGYSMVGQASTTCQANGSWTNPGPTCTAAFSITNCPATILSGYIPPNHGGAVHSNAHKNAKFFAAGGSSYSWELTGPQSTLTGTGGSFAVSNMVLGTYTLTLNGTMSCSFNVDGYTSYDVSAANWLSNASNWATLSEADQAKALLLYDWDASGSITLADKVGISNNR